LLVSFRETRRRHGALAALRVSLESHLSRHRVTLHLLGLTHPHALPPPHEFGIEGRFATREDLERMVSSGEQKADARALLDQGDACLLQLVDGRMAGWAWLSTRDEVELLPGLFLTIPRDAGYVFRTWTVPEMRGHGLQPRRTLELLEEGRRRGRQRLLCFVESTNLASLKGVGKAGYERVAILRWTTQPGRPRRARLEIESPEWRGLAVKVEDAAARP
jgi:ribosomal protein S18 acetylase RimI-like enzyme